MNFYLKSEDTWESCFDFLFHYTKFSFLPPFHNPSLLFVGYFIVFMVTIMLFRGAAMLIQQGTQEFEYGLVTFKFTYLVAKGFIFLATRNTTQQTLKKTINLFLQKNKSNAVNGKDHQFLQLWDKMKPIFFVKWFYRTEVVMAVIWLSQAFYLSVRDHDRPWKSRFPFASPYYNYSSVTRWAYPIFDWGMCFACVFQNVHNDIVLIAFFSFLECQVTYLRKICREISKKEERDDRDLRWWLENHQMVLRYSEDLNNMIKYIVLSTFFFNVGQIVFCILTYSQENTNQGLIQKFLMLIFLLGELLVVVGYQCKIVENINEIHFFLYEPIYTVDYIFGEKKQKYFLKMLIVRTQKDIKFRGYSFFTMCFRDLKELVLTTYQVYASLSSVKGKT